jgi:phthalate 4,5-cis-dihydrodiol dehydrogenase
MRKPTRIGIAGLGAAGRAFIPAFEKHPGFDFTAFADPSPQVRDSGAADTGARPFADIPSLLREGDIDALYVATPTELHPEHVEAAFAAGKHVLTEKPMAVSLSDAQRMVDAAALANRVLLVGHAHGFDMPIRAMRDVVASGRLGRVRMINTWNFTDWIYRPRRPDEFDLSLGGGVTFRQGSHQFDIIRLLGGGLVRSVRASAFDWDPQRSAIGAHTVFLHFVDGTSATAVYNGYGYFNAMELVNDVTEWGFLEPLEARAPVNRPSNTRTAADELEAKRRRAKGAIPGEAPYQPTFGLTLVSCERGDIRQSRSGLYIYSEGGREEIVLPTDRTPRDLVLEEFYDAMTGVRPPVHDGRWGLANLEICVAALQSAREGREIELSHQVAVPG